ncbi:tumor suppressor candidate 2-like isoform X1 [Salvelinus fontinalis]|uniref:tumor suppressor candidate 2-like isoform X1 n=2 Tax=Salvelinus fontinalis TaxID=8038 RepID=UPI002484E28C|nr:tumor suppressor candidate 2-like isoform X1 [Salvelinus fontinalis]
MSQDLSTSTSSINSLHLSWVQSGQENNVLQLKMGGSGSKTKGYWPFAGSGSGDGDPTKEGVDEQSLARMRSFRNGTPFVFTRWSSLYFDEDGDLAHEFYEETVVMKNGRRRAKLKKIQKNLIPQGTIKLDHPCIHVDFPVVLCEV